MSNKKQRNAAKRARKKQEKLATKQALAKGEYYENQQNATQAQPKAYEQLNYKITSDPIIDEETRLADEIEQQREDIYYQIKNRDFDPPKLVEQLESLCEQFPEDKTFANYLVLAYQLNKDTEKSVELIKTNFEKRPDYLFARFQLAEHYINDQQFEELYPLFDGKFDLKLLCPGRDVFHISEVKSMLHITAHYAGFIKNEELFFQQYDILQELDSESAELLRLMPWVMSFRLEKMMMERKATKNALEI